MISSFAELKDNNKEVLDATLLSLREGLARQVFITGDAEFIRAYIPDGLSESVTILEADQAAACSALAVEIVRQMKADILIKGAVDSKNFLRAVVNRETGIRSSQVLSNITVAEMPSVPRLLGATDNGIVPYPDLEMKKQIILNTRFLYRGLGYSSIKVAAVTASEKVIDKLVATTDAAKLAEMSARGDFPGFIVDGPFGYDVALSLDAALTKGLANSPVAGLADLLLFPTIDAANAVAKSWKYHGAAQTGSIVLGATVPVLLNSRSDSARRRVNALTLGIAEAIGRKFGA